MLKIPAIISKIQTLADNTLRIQVDANELEPEQELELFKMRKYPGVFLFHPQDIKKEDLVNLPEPRVEKGEKSPSQVLRSRLFVFHKEMGIKEDFDAWYRREMDRIGQKYLEKLE